MAQEIEKNLTYEQVAETVIELGNQLIDEDESADIWEVASGIMAGAVQFWLASHQPCDDLPGDRGDPQHTRDLAKGDTEQDDRREDQ